MSYFIFENKQIYYQEFGNGTPLLFLHGNTASSNIFYAIAKKYAENHTVILIDFLGHGKSQRLESFPTDLWFFEAKQVIAFLEEKNYAHVNLVGSSGGALVAMNVALERPDLVHKVVADSFEGETALKEFTKNIQEQREYSKKDKNAIAFYSSMHGEDWAQIVDCDTLAIVKHAEEIGGFFHKPLQYFHPPILLTGSKQDEFLSSLDPNYLEKTYKNLLAKIGHGEICIFEKGGHPAMLSNQEEFIEKINIYLNK